jgi:type II secretory pathway pseudopilin PulG
VVGRSFCARAGQHHGNCQLCHTSRTAQPNIPDNDLVPRLNCDRRGLSLPELVVVVALAGLVGGTILGMITRQQRFYRGASELLTVHEGVRDAMEVLSADVRAASAADTVRLAADSAIEFFSTIGASVVCQIGGSEVGLPAAHSSGNSLTVFRTEPDTGDLVLFHVDAVGENERWERHRIAGFVQQSLASSCPPASRLSLQSDLDAGRRGFVITLTSPLAGGVKVGAVVRFVRRERYSLYRASDGDWYLGYRRCNAIGPSACGSVQPVSGPYLAHSRDPKATGLLFEYFDAVGRMLGVASAPLALARVDITARSESGYRLPSGEPFGRRISDSATVSLAIRK